MSDIPITESCFTSHMGIYLMEPEAFRVAAEAVRSGMLPADVEGARARARAADDSFRAQDGGKKPFRTISGGIAVVDLAGTLMKGFSKFGGSSTVFARRQIRAAVADPDVLGILIRIDSPGGHTAGTAELADDIRAAHRDKPTHAFVEDLGASAAYWAAAGAGRITVNPIGEVGSIGVVAVVRDASKRLEMAGVTTHVLSTGEFKGAFIEGTEITDEQLAYLQQRIEGINDHFQKAVRDGRNLDDDTMRKVSDGRVFNSARARELGLVDDVGSFGKAVGTLTAAIRQAQFERSATAATAEIDVELASMPDPVPGQE